MSSSNRDDRPERIVYVERRPVVTEQTGKGWKSIQALGVVLAAIGWGVLCSGATSGNSSAFGIFLFSGVVGGGLFLFGRIGAWWYHG